MDPEKETRTGAPANVQASLAALWLKAVLKSSDVDHAGRRTELVSSVHARTHNGISVTCMGLS